MKLEEAVKFGEIGYRNAYRARLAISEMKRQYAKSSKALIKRGYKPKQLKEIQKKLKEKEDLYKKPIKDLNINQLREVYSTYRDYFYSPKFGFKNSTYKQYKENLKKQEKILGIKGFSGKKWDEDQRTELWELINEVRNLGTTFFMQNGLSPDYLYSSGRNVKEIAIYIDKTGLDDPVKLLDRLEADIKLAKEHKNEEDYSEFR